MFLGSCESFVFSFDLRFRFFFHLPFDEIRLLDLHFRDPPFEILKEMFLTTKQILHLIKACTDWTPSTWWETCFWRGFIRTLVNSSLIIFVYIHIFKNPIIFPLSPYSTRIRITYSIFHKIKHLLQKWN